MQSSARSRARILLVDDRPANLLALEAILDPLGHEVHRATSGQEALALIRAHHPFAVVLLDLFMPGMDGLETARAIRTLEHGRHTPIVLVTGADDSRERMLEAYEVGVADFLMKPVNPVMLRAKVSVFVELFHREELIRAEATQRARAERERDFLRALDEERERLLAQAEAANRAKDEFLALVSHELRTPVNAILGWTRMLNSDTLDEEARGKALLIVERNARAQSKLIEDLLDASRAVTGKLQIELAQTDFASVVRAAVDSMRPAADAKGVTLEARLPPIPPMALDGDRLQQVVCNLVSNAIKFTPREGRVDVDVAVTGDRAVLRVKDTGIGIRRESLPKVFERFWQADDGTTRRFGGLGLGLAIVRHIVEAHGGAVNAESEGEGRGATFMLTLPIRAWSEGAVCDSAPALLATAPTAERLDGLRVLVVDDEADARELVATVLSASGAEVCGVTNATLALDSLVATRPDVLVSDVGMPNVDGYELLRRVRLLDDPRIAEIPAVAVTAYDRDDDRRRARNAGFQAHVPKPIDPAKLVAVIASLRRASALRAAS